MGRRSREEEEKGRVIEVLDKSHKERDHFDGEVSAVDLHVGLSRPSIFKQCVGISLVPYSSPYMYLWSMQELRMCRLFYRATVPEKKTVSGHQIFIR